MTKKLISSLFVLLLTTSVWAAPPAVYVKQTTLPIETAYDRIYQALEANKFWVVFEADLTARMARFADRWGDDYNRQGLSAAKSMVFCNIWWTNRIASTDPELLSLCPLSLSLYEKDGVATVVMTKPSVISKGSKGQAAAKELENELVGIIENAVKQK